MSRLPSAAVPIAQVVLYMVIILNWIFGAFILAAFAYTFINEPFTMRALSISRMSDAPALMMIIRVVGVLGLAIILLDYAMLRRLLSIVATVRCGDPFVAENARRLQVIAWLLLALQLVSMAIAGIAEEMTAHGHPLHLNAGFSISGWLAVLLTFILAHVFAQGARMREDLEGTV